MGLFEHKYPYENFHELNLDWILSEIKSFSDTINSWSEDIETLKQYLTTISGMDARITALETATSDLSTIRINITDLYSSISALSLEDADLQNQINSINTKFDGIQSQFDNVYGYIDNQIAILKAVIDGYNWDIQTEFNTQIVAINMAIALLEDRINSLDTSVINCWHTELGRISQDANNKLVYGDLADECLTAEEYCSLGLSASDYDSFDISARDYQEFGKKKLHFRWVYMPVEGVRQEISNVLTSIINNVFGTLTSDEYTALDLDSDGYTLLDLTAGQYQKYNVNGM